MAAVEEAWRRSGGELYEAATAGDAQRIRLLLDEGSGVPDGCDIGSLLEFAVRSGRLDVVSALLLRVGAEVGAEDGDVLVEASGAPMLRLLLEYGADVDAADETGWTALHRAATEDDLPSLTLLLDASADPNRAAEDDVTPLFAAALSGSLEAVRLLKARGASAALVPPVAGAGQYEFVPVAYMPHPFLYGEELHGRIALQERCFAEAGFEAQRALAARALRTVEERYAPWCTWEEDRAMERPDPPSLPEPPEPAPAERGAAQAPVAVHPSWGDPPELSGWAEARAWERADAEAPPPDAGEQGGSDDPGEEGADHEPPGRWVGEGEQGTETAGGWWDPGEPDPDSSKWGELALAEGGLFPPLLALFAASVEGDAEGVRRILVTSGADPDAPVHGAKTALMLCASRCHSDSVRTLLAAGADPNVTDDVGRTALHHALRHVPDDRNGWDAPLETVRLLLGGGADPNAAAFDGWTPLHDAAYHGAVPFVEALLDAGAAPDPADRDGWTPLMWAARLGHGPAAALLVAHGADPRRADAEGRDAFAHGAPYPEVTAILTGGGGAGGWRV